MKRFAFIAATTLMTIGLLFHTSPSWGREKLFYHEVRLDSNGLLLPWYDADPGRSYDHVIGLVWNFWNTMRNDQNGLPYYMNHQVWRKDFNDSRGIGGDQIQMALSSWRLLYAYTGNENVKQNMKFMADYYLSHSLSPSHAKWANLPFPFNTLLYSGVYDGDMIIGRHFLQPDKAGSLGLELARMYKLTISDFNFYSNAKRYLAHAIEIAQSLASHLEAGDAQNSPLPFKVNAMTGEIGPLLNNTDDTVVGLASYTTNWAPTMELFLELQTLDPAHAADYQRGFDVLLSWMKAYPMKTNSWGPFFEDVRGYSDTQINAMTFARFIMEHRDYFENWQQDVSSIFAWTYKTLGSEYWSKYGVSVVNEQTSYQTPGESHVARQGADELLFARLTGDAARRATGIRQLNWATYSVDLDGKNLFPSDEHWLTDGYGDYVRHYFRAMAVAPELAPGSFDHILSSTSVVQQADYKGSTNKFQLPYVWAQDVDRLRVYYRTFASSGSEVVRLTAKPSSVTLNGAALHELTQSRARAAAYVAPGTQAAGYRWTQLAEGGYLEVFRDNGTDVVVLE